MKQSRRMSLVETLASTAVGFGIAWGTNLLVLPRIPPTVSGSFWIACIFTGVSLVRGYCLRRFFNWLHHRKGPFA
jgi:hypothetical protein